MYLYPNFHPKEYPNILISKKSKGGYQNSWISLDIGVDARGPETEFTIEKKDL